ncbi:MAG TPA: carbohydrate kinase family protein [Patescibacteria group bacterium]
MAIPHLVLTGSVAVDRIMIYPGSFAEVIQPDKLHVLSLSLLLNELKETRGGVAANIAYSLALLGEKPSLLASVGENARHYMADLAELGVQTDTVYYSHLPTATFTVMTDTHNCQIGGFYPGAMSDAQSLSLHDLSPADTLVVISPHDPTQMAVQVQQCAAAKRRLFYDVGQQINNISADDIRAGVAATELLIINDYEYEVLQQKTGWTEQELLQKVKTIVVTLGEKGSIIKTGSGREKTKNTKVPAVKIKKVIDPTGAGDAFRAGFLYGYVREWDLERCAQLGSVAASFVVEKHGAQEHTFTRKDIEKRYTATYEGFL